MKEIDIAKLQEMNDHDLLVELEFPLGNGEPAGGRAETLTQRIERVGNLGAVRGAPRFGDDLAVAENHDAVDAVKLFVELGYRVRESGGIESDRFGRRAGKRAVFVKILRKRDGRKRRG